MTNRYLKKLTAVITAMLMLVTMLPAELVTAESLEPEIAAEEAEQPAEDAGELEEEAGQPADETIAEPETPAEEPAADEDLPEEAPAVEDAVPSEDMDALPKDGPESTGSLLVSNTLAGNDYDASDVFHFSITLNDKGINGTYGEAEFTDGYAEITIPGTGSSLISGLPAAIGYMVMPLENSTRGYYTEVTSLWGVISAGVTKECAFTNTRNTYGTLKITERTEGEGADAEKKFSFTVKLSETMTNGQYYITDADGIRTVYVYNGDTFTFALKSTESATISGLPNGASYIVTETDGNRDGYKLTVTGDTGTITGNTAFLAAFTNSVAPVGNLSVSEVTDGNAADEEKEFSFTVTLGDKNINGVYGDVTFENGTAHFKLKDGAKAVITGLPDGTAYSVTQDDADEDGYDSDSNGDKEGTITGGTTAKLYFYNFKDSFGSLTVSNAVSGNAGDKTKEFNFTVTLDDTSVNGVKGDMTFTGGVAKFTLKDGESVTASGLANGTGYTVAEAEAWQDGYVTSRPGYKGTITGDSVVTAAYTNVKNTFGTLTVRELTNGAGSDTAQEFSFTVELDDKTINGDYGNMTFVDGVASFTLTDGDDKTATDLPNGTGYKVTVSPETGYNTSWTNDLSEGTIEGSALTHVVCVNYRGTGGLSVTNNMSTGATGYTFNYTVKLSDKSITGMYGELYFEDGEEDFYLSSGNSVTVTGLPEGIGYTVEEDSEGVVCTDSGNTEGIIEDGTIQDVVFTNSIDRKGSIVIKNNASGNDLGTGEDSYKVISYKVTVDHALNIEGIFDNSNVSEPIYVPFNGSVTIDGIPAGEKYKVSVATTDDSYKITPSEVSGMVIADSESTAVFDISKYSKGTLSVTNTVSGNAADKNKAFTYTVTLEGVTDLDCGDLKFENGTATFTLKGGESVTVAGIPDGTAYTVTESGNKGYEVSVTGDKGTVSASDFALAAFTNTCDSFGELQVIECTRGDWCDADKSFEITVTLGDDTVNGTYGDMEFTSGVATFTLKDNETKTAKDLPNGVSYEVTEKDYSAEGYITLWGATRSGNVYGGSTTQVAVVNDRETGYLTVTNTVTAGDLGKVFQYTVTLDDRTLNSKKGDMEFINGVATLELTSGGSATAELPNGVGYAVTQRDYSADGYSTVKTGDTGKIAEFETSTAAFKNKINTYGGIWVWCFAPDNSDVEFTYTVKLDDISINGTYGDMKFENGVAAFKLVNGNSAKAEGLPAGTDFTVSELEAGMNGFTTLGWLDESEDRIETNALTGRITTDTVTAVHFTNKKTAGGKLTVSLSVTGNSADTAREFTFTVKLEGEKVLNGTYGDMSFTAGTATFTLKDGESRTAENIPEGMTYTVTESSYDDYKVSATGDEGTVKASAPATAAFTDKRDLYGDLWIINSVSGNDYDPEKEFKFTLELSDKSVSGMHGDLNFSNGVAVFTMKDSDMIVAQSLPYGVTYTVKQLDANEDGYVTEQAVQTGSIASSMQLRAFSISRDTMTGSLTVKNVMKGSDAEADRDVQFTVVVNSTDINGTYGGMTFSRGVSRFTLKGGESLTAADMPNGLTYYVFEEDLSADNYKTSVKGQSGTIDSDAAEQAQCVFTNTRNLTGTLTVKNSVTGGDPDKEFSFKVVLSDDTVSSVFAGAVHKVCSNGLSAAAGPDGMTFSGGVAEFTLKAGESVSAFDLPAGVEYTVTMGDYSAEGYKLVSSTGASGTIAYGEESTAEFKLVYSPVSDDETTGSLKVINNVRGDEADHDKYFTYTFSFDEDGSYVYTGSKSGTVSDGDSVKLKDGEYIVISGIPAGTHYTVTESDSDDYTVTKTGYDGSIPGGGTAEAVFTNTKGAVPQTGDTFDMNMTLWLMGASLILAVLLGILLVLKRRRG